MSKLSLRLQSLLDRCASGGAFWDLCCDHGLLGLEALRSGRFSEVIFNDRVPHLTEALRSRLPEEVRVITCPAEEIQEPLTGNVVLAGIGGERILHILRSHQSRGGLRAKRIIACPEKDADWLAEQRLPDYQLVESTKIPHGAGTRLVFVWELVVPRS